MQTKKYKLSLVWFKHVSIKILNNNRVGNFEAPSHNTPKIYILWCNGSTLSSVFNTCVGSFYYLKSNGKLIILKHVNALFTLQKTIMWHKKWSTLPSPCHLLSAHVKHGNLVVISQMIKVGKCIVGWITFWVIWLVFFAVNVMAIITFYCIFQTLSIGTHFKV
jgi:hypothetical protein